VSLGERRPRFEGQVSRAEWSWSSADFRATATEHEIMNQPERSQSQQSRIRSTGQEAVIIWDARWGGCAGSRLLTLAVFAVFASSSTLLISPSLGQRLETLSWLKIIALLL
jgi:hypothetical protein